MPSKSKSQQRLMGQAYAYKTGKKKAKDLNTQYADEIKDLAKSMTKNQLKDFAETDHKGLPQKVKESRIMNFESFNESKYTFEDFTTNDMEMVKELYEEGLTDSKQLSIEMDLPVETIIQILDTLKRRGEINEGVLSYLKNLRLSNYIITCNVTNYEDTEEDWQSGRYTKDWTSKNYEYVIKANSEKEATEEFRSLWNKEVSSFEPRPKLNIVSVKLLNDKETMGSFKNKLKFY